MPRSATFRLNRSGLLLALISAAFAGQADAAAGRVEFAVGDATVVGTDGRGRPVARGTELDTGDTVRTTDGRVQVRMSDGAFISLQPNTEFGIKDYRFEGKTDGTESAFYSLVKGAMRTVTGFIGRVNRDKYRVATPTATVGIRGTGGLIQVLLDGSTLVHGTSGIWFLANPAGSIDIPAGVSGLAPADPKQPPTETSDVPTAGPTPPTELVEYVQGDQRTITGDPVISPPTTAVLLSGGGYSAAVAWSNFGSPIVDQVISGTATFNSSGQLTRLDVSSGSLPVFYSLENGSHADFGTDGILAWGRWIGETSIPCDGPCLITYDANQGLHYVIGMPTASMPQSGSAKYTLLGATQPTYLDGSSTTPGAFSGSLSVTFGQAATVGMNFNVSMPNSRSYTLTGSTTATGAAFSADTLDRTLSVSGSCASSCSGSVRGFFSGATAERAGVGYFISDPLQTTGTSIGGAAAFKKQ